MRLLSQEEAMDVSGAAWLKFVLPVVVGFAIGGPAGAVYAAGTLVATAGATNLEHLYAHDKIPTIHDTINS